MIQTVSWTINEDYISCNSLYLHVLAVCGCCTFTPSILPVNRQNRGLRKECQTVVRYVNSGWVGKLTGHGSDGSTSKRVDIIMLGIRFVAHRLPSDWRHRRYAHGFPEPLHSSTSTPDHLGDHVRLLQLILQSFQFMLVVVDLSGHDIPSGDLFSLYIVNGRLCFLLEYFIDMTRGWIWQLRLGGDISVNIIWCENVFCITIMTDGFAFISSCILPPAIHRVSDSTCRSGCDDWPTLSCRVLPSGVVEVGGGRRKRDFHPHKICWVWWTYECNFEFVGMAVLQRVVSSLTLLSRLRLKVLMSRYYVANLNKCRFSLWHLRASPISLRFKYNTCYFSVSIWSWSPYY